MRMQITTVCYIENDAAYLMLHRVKKEQDPNAGKWIGIGGHLENGESPEDCNLREVFEETGLQLLDARLRGLVTFVSDVWGTEYMFIFTAARYEGTLREDCEEGVLQWVPKDRILDLDLWEGDRIFHRLLLETDVFFSLKLVYAGDMLVRAERY